MGQGPYDHPSYLARQQICLGRTTAGAAGTSILYTFPSAMRLRTVTCGVITAGTVVGTGAGLGAAGISLLNGTAIVSGTLSLSTNAKGVFATSGDLNYTVPAGGTLAVVNGTDATFVGIVNLEAHLDPGASWTGNG